MSAERFESAMQQVLGRYGVAAESRFVDAPAVNGRAHVLVSGDGPAVVLINGGGTPAAMLAPLMAELPGYRLYAIDLPGFGLTDTNPAFVSDLRSNSVAFVRDTLDRLGLDRVSTVANSFGSLVTMWAALDMAARVSTSVHVGCPAIILKTAAPLPMRMLSTRLGPLIMRVDSPSPRQVSRLSKVVREHPLDPAIRDLLLETERLDGYSDALVGMYRKLIRLAGARPEMALGEDDLARISQPTQLIWGEDDPFGSPDVGRNVAAAMPNAELHVVPGGHAPWLRHSAEVGLLVRSFLARSVRSE
jgi:pimeloyl-ACP methyl ester carboxylesterase